MAGQNLIPSGDFRTSYAVDTTIFPTRASRNAAIIGVIDQVDIGDEVEVGA